MTVLSREQSPGAAQASLTVDASEAGLKLMGLLERRMSLPQALLHRWIRTGQVRVNGKRTQPFARVAEADVIRIPPFAEALAAQAKTAHKRQQERAAAKKHFAALHGAHTHDHTLESARQSARQASVEIIAEDDDFFAVFKPAGLPVHSGTGHADCLAARLASLARDDAFRPTPVHRLDRDTTGVLLVARTYQALRRMQDAIRTRAGVHKEYLVWVRGLWPSDRDVTLRHYLSRGMVGSRERILASTCADRGHEAILVARCLKKTPQASLLQVRIVTGRTHQIRVQLATEGYPVLGDGKYGTASPDHTLYLHSLRMVLADGRVFEALPRWREPLAVDSLPPVLSPGPSPQ